MYAKFIESYDVLSSFRSGTPVVIDGNSLSIPAVTATARYGAQVTLDDSQQVRDRVLASRQVIVGKVGAEKSVYGVSTGFGGSADTRTNNPLLLGHALLQHQHAGILPSSTNAPLPGLPLLDPLTSTSMPEAWVRGAILIRMNSLIRGHSGVRWELIEKMNALLRENITPLVPLRGSISASGDLSPLSYIAGTLIGNPTIRVFDGPASFGARQVVPSSHALAAHGVEPIPLSSKEHLGILNGTAFSASVAALALNDAVHLTLLAQVATAMGTEAMLGSKGSFDPFIHNVARPHPGQVEVAANILDLLNGSRLATGEEEECHIDEDAGELRQDRYPLRTSAQFLGPQVEDILSALEVVTLECNCTTDNPLVDGETGIVHHGGNFQAMAVTNAMEKTRLALHHIGKLLFAQCTELVNPQMNRGLPPNLAATDASHNYFAKGIDIHTASYVGELGYLANPVSTHIQSAELHNQAVNSLALISARATINSLEVLSLLTSSYILALCQALDLRALQYDYSASINTLTRDLLTRHFGTYLSTSQLDALYPRVTKAIAKALDATSNADAGSRLQQVAAATTTPIVDFCASEGTDAITAITNIMAFRAELAEQGAIRLNALRAEYLEGKRGLAPASQYLGKTKALYEFVRITLGVRLHGLENLHNWEDGPGSEELTIGQNISLIHEAIRDGKIQPVVVQMLHKA
ncbi:phenylalanine ammonia-lyase [Irpex rosettiformis]|uniref:Phenylalanine ammonia-lyase n=1 Tax=Irpex rosettiformis TaxID=378272 RepID=A0ACB8U8U2_9APHY|nr:phenylalanine ammonia-lyase [Irpex rosettiformis]